MAKTFAVNNREREIILFALESLKSNLDDEAQLYLADRFQASSGPDEDPRGAEGVPSEVEENEIDGLVRRIEKHFGTGRGSSVSLGGNPGEPMSKQEIRGILRAWIKDFAIDPNDAGSLYAETPSAGVDRETFGDMLEGYGYPNLTKEIYERK